MFSFSSAACTPSRSDTDTHIRHTANHHRERSLAGEPGENPGENPGDSLSPSANTVPPQQTPINPFRRAARKENKIPGWEAVKSRVKTN